MIKKIILVTAIAAMTSACAVTKIVTVPVKIVAKTVETAADIVD